MKSRENILLLLLGPTVVVVGINMIAEDISMDVYVILQTRFQENSLKFKRNTLAFIWNMVRNKMIDEDKRIGRFGVDSTPHQEDRDNLEESIIFASDESPEEIYLWKEKIEIIKSVIAKLYPFERCLICLKYKEGLSHGEIGEIIGEDRNYVGVMFYHLRKKLLKLIRDYILMY